MKTRSLPERLDDKSAQALLTNHFRERYNYNPAMAEAIFRDTVFVRTLLDPASREDGQIIRYFPKASEPAGKPLKDCEYVAVRITLYAAGDVDLLAKHGTKALRQWKLKRICDEALAQGAPATQEDLAVLLGCHRSTINRDISEMKAQGNGVVTRGDVTDQGRGISHKRPILKMYLLGLPPSEVGRRTGHTLESVEGYVEPFFRIVCLHSEGKEVGAICRITQLSRKLVEEYMAIYRDLAADPVFAEPLAKRMHFFQEGLLPLTAKRGTS
jgi:biotin operon repressor